MTFPIQTPRDAGVPQAELTGASLNGSRQREAARSPTREEIEAKWRSGRTAQPASRSPR